MSENAEGIITEVDEKDVNTKNGPAKKFRLKLDADGDTLSFETWNADQAKLARDLLNDSRMVRINWEQEDSWTDRDGNTRAGARKVKTLTGPLREAQQSGNGAVPDAVWTDKDRRIVRQNSWRHACVLGPLLATEERPLTLMRVQEIASHIEGQIVKGTDLEQQTDDDAKDIPF